MFISNHPILGLEFPLLLSEVYKQTGIFLRALTDHSHWQVRSIYTLRLTVYGINDPVYVIGIPVQIPMSGQVMRDVIGAAEGTARNVDLLLSHGRCVSRV